MEGSEKESNVIEETRQALNPTTGETDRAVPR